MAFVATANFGSTKSPHIQTRYMDEWQSDQMKSYNHLFPPRKIAIAGQQSNQLTLLEHSINN